MIDGLFGFESVVFFMVVSKKNPEIRLFFYLLAGVLVLCGALLGYGLFSPVEVVINDDGLIYSAESKASSVLDFLMEQEIEFAFHDKIYPGLYAPIEEGTEVVIERTVPVVITQPAADATYYTSAANVKELLEEMAVPLDGTYFITPLPESPVVPGMQINLVPRRVSTEFEQQRIPHDTRQNEDKDLPKGKHLIVQEGQDGIRELEYKVVYAGDEEISRELVQERIIKEPATAVINIGTKVETAPAELSVASRGERRENYSAEGIASWYGSEFHGRRTSSGEIYDQYGLTAAHRSLPFGTKVKVTFLRTEKSIEVIINDRGPLKRERIIDLSRAAAEAIGLKPYGIGLVRVDVIE